MGVGVVDQRLVAGFAGRRDVGEAAVVADAVAQVGCRAHASRDDVVEEGSEWLDHEVERTGDEQRSVAEAAMLAHAPDRGGERLGEDQIAEHLRRVFVDLVDRRTLVATVEEAQEVAAVEAIELEQRRPFEYLLRDEPSAVVVTQAARGQPRIRRDDIGRDERVLEIERRDVTIGRQHLHAQAFGTRLRLPCTGCGLDARLLHDARHVHVVDVGGPIDRARIEWIRRAVVLVE